MGTFNCTHPLRKVRHSLSQDVPVLFCVLLDGALSRKFVVQHGNARLTLRWGPSSPFPQLLDTESLAMFEARVRIIVINHSLARVTIGMFQLRHITITDI